jgi:hypothetical protein
MELLEVSEADLLLYPGIEVGTPVMFLQSRTVYASPWEGGSTPFF